MRTLRQSQASWRQTEQFLPQLNKQEIKQNKRSSSGSRNFAPLSRDACEKFRCVCSAALASGRSHVAVYTFSLSAQLCSHASPHRHTIRRLQGTPREPHAIRSGDSRLFLRQTTTEGAAVVGRRNFLFAEQNASSATNVCTRKPNPRTRAGGRRPWAGLGGPRPCIEATLENPTCLKSSAGAGRASVSLSDRNGALKTLPACMPARPRTRCVWRRKRPHK